MILERKLENPRPFFFGFYSIISDNFMLFAPSKNFFSWYVFSEFHLFKYGSPTLIRCKQSGRTRATLKYKKRPPTQDIALFFRSSTRMMTRLK